MGKIRKRALTTARNRSKHLLNAVDVVRKSRAIVCRAKGRNNDENTTPTDEMRRLVEEAIATGAVPVRKIAATHRKIAKPAEVAGEHDQIMLTRYGESF